MAISRKRMKYLRDVYDYRIKKNKVVNNEGHGGPNFGEAVNALLEMMDEVKRLNRIIKKGEK